jgi:thiosulfate reductase cytochrome b subunit
MTTAPLRLPATPRDAPDPARRELVPRHSALVRVTHWINVLSLALLLMSGAQIFNAYPRLHWGVYGADFDPAVIEIRSLHDARGWHGLFRAGPLHLDTTGVLGASREGGAGALAPRAFPSWLTIPSYQDLATGRRWHFFWAWVFVLNGLAYLSSGFARRHFARDLLPARAEMAPRHLWQEIVDHARLRFAQGQAARHYNVLQKLAYLAVIFVLLPMMVLTGLSMSPGVNAALPLLPDLFGGRPSARTLHFVTASLLVAFVVVHVVMVVVSGLWNNLRSMITGRYAIETAGAPAVSPRALGPVPADDGDAPAGAGAQAVSDPRGGAGAPAESDLRAGAGTPAEGPPEPGAGTPAAGHPQAGDDPHAEGAAR